MRLFVFFAGFFFVLCDLLKEFVLLLQLELIVCKVICLELQLALHFDLAILVLLLFILLNFLQGLCDAALVFGLLKLVNVIESVVVDARASISKASDAEQCLDACSFIRECAKNQHCNSGLVISCAEVQATAAEVGVDEVNRVPVVFFDIHMLNQFQVKLFCDLDDTWLQGESVVV